VALANTIRNLLSPTRRLSVCAVLAMTGLATACASRPEVGFLSPVADTIAGASDHTLLVATTRERDPRPGTLFNGERASPLDYAEITVSVPPTHATGAIEWASSAPGSPKTNFVVRQAEYLDGDKQFIRTLNAELAKHPRGKRKVFVFIHGYNTMFAEGLYRFTQVVHDSGSVAVPVLFTWRRAGRSASMSTTTTARRRHATTLSTRFACFLPATPTRSTFSPIPWAIG
jgi:esterase/lipase superfamily enzyme